MDHIFYLGTLMCVWVTVSLAANFVIGYTGMMAMGQAVYLGFGAYVAAALNIYLGVNYFVAMVVAALASGAVAVLTLVPLLRLSGFYFALATLGLNFVFFDLYNNLGPRVEGSEGLYGLILPALLASPRPQFVTTLLITIGCILAANHLVNAPFGRALRATRDQPDALIALGKNPTHYQIVVWGVSGALTGLAGALYAATLLYIDPTLFTLNASILVLVYVGVGGLASNAGSVLGPVLLITFTESFRYFGLPSVLAGPIQQGLYGALLIGLMLFRRQGLVGKHDFQE
ncbi:MAG: branched-chain amino acid ABC transporter permease [Hyphomicrobiales bacterium]|nr:branched-chain amino acid ABC transporter permease [Hyphomicrobiales bacterium]